MDELILTRKLKLWQNKLLDLSKRNRMISFKDSSTQVIRFMEPDFEELYTRLVVNGHSMQIKRPIDRNVDATVFAMMRLMHHLSERLNVGKGEIRTSDTLEVSARTIRNIKRHSDLSIQEKGANILYLAFGFLYWRDRDTRGDWLKAPLILVPASLNQDSINQPFSVKKTEEDIVVNPTFVYYLEVNHGIKLPELKNASEFSEVISFLEQTASVVERLGWRVEQEVYLATMSFLKTNMYNDLVENESQIMSHPIIRAFAGDRNEFTTLDEAATDFQHDTTDVENVYEILNADSSQKDAVELSHRGISFVMQGPPGTGKSQTIANIIGQAVAEGKKVLFVSEKLAALDVVYRRLRDVGIADLCLPLHDPKTSKQVVLKQLEHNLDAPKDRVSNEKIAELHQLDGLKADLNAYAHLLHQVQEPLHMSLYEAYQMLFSLSDTEDVILSLPRFSEVNRAGMNRMIREVSEYETSRDRLGDGWYSHPWAGIKKQNLTNASKQRLKEFIELLLKNLEPVQEFSISESKHLGDVITWSNRQEYEAIGRLIAGCSVVPESMILNSGSWQADELPENVKASQARLAGFYGVDEQEFLAVIDEMKQRGNANAEALRKLRKQIDMIDGLDESLTYLQIFQVMELLFQFGLDARKLSLTENYFSTEGLLKIEQLRAKRKKQFDEAEKLRQSLLTRYTEAVLNLPIAVTEEELSELTTQISSLGKNNGESLFLVLETEHGIRIANRANEEELFSVIKTLLDGVFDHFADLSTNEFYFVYDLLEEAKQREEAGDAAWFNDFGGMLQQYTGVDLQTAKKGTWNDLLALSNDFYYVKTVYPELLIITHFGSSEKNVLKETLRRISSHDPKAEETCSSMTACSLTEQAYAYSVMSEDARSIFAYQQIYLRAQQSYMDDVAVFGNQYLMGSTDWELVGRNIAFAQEANLLFQGAGSDAVKKLLIEGSKIDWTQLKEVLQQILDIKDKVPVTEKLSVKTAIDSLSESITAMDQLKANTAKWSEMCFWADKINRAVYRDGELIYDRDMIRFMLGDSKELFDLLDLLCGMKEQEANIQGLLEVYEDSSLLTDMSISNLRKHLTACLAQFTEYDTMVEYQICAEHCREDGLNDFIQRAYRIRKRHGTLSKLFEKAFLTAWIDIISESQESISAFSSRIQENKINAFSVLDKKQLKIARERILTNSYDRMPSRSAGKVVGEMGVLLREISKSRNAMTIRQLFNNIPHLLLTLKPCLMMSPLSVAYFLKADLYCFDMVIFDEASQIFPENAIGAILRGKQVIISGDSKQMPPTSFFQTALGSQEEDEEDDTVTNNDSILEEAENVLPNLSLTWHYRSRNESLITFSNRNMYSGSLVTFPNNAPNGTDSGVEYEYVADAVYENRCNEAEAFRCVQLTIEHFRTHPDRSIGIIAFSISQEDCIERVFNDYRSSHPQYEEFFKETRENPFFIKNLENVQGDERDTILLSVGYGKNAQGVLRYNFGPLGMQGGERRMNVAITRAKHNIKLVTSLRPDDFDEARTESNAGAKLLYDYIVYAMYGPNVDIQATAQQSSDGFKQYLCNVLKEAGYKTALNIGHSGYKVEIAVEDPNHAGSYVIGIETDGRAYNQARTARDRECLRPDMLYSMGWSMYRAWSTQWIRDPETEKKKLLGYIEQKIELALKADEPALKPEVIHEKHQQPEAIANSLEITEESSDT